MASVCDLRHVYHWQTQWEACTKLRPDLKVTASVATLHQGYKGDLGAYLYKK